MDPVLAETITTIGIICLAGFIVFVAALVGVLIISMRKHEDDE